MDDERMEIMAEDEVLPQQPYRRYFDAPITLEEAEGCIEANLVTTARMYVATGYYLKRIRDDRLYEEGGYKNFEEYVRGKYGKDKGWASKCIRVSQQLSVDGDSPFLDSAYKDYSTYQLVELAYMTEEQRKLASPEQTVKQLQEIRRPEKVVMSQPEEDPEQEPGADEQLPDQMDITDFPQFLPENMPPGAGDVQEDGLPEVFQMDVSQMLPGETGEGASEDPQIQDSTEQPAEESDRPFWKQCICGLSPYGNCVCCGFNGIECCAQCSEDCNARCGWIDDSRQDGTPDAAEPKIIDAESEEIPEETQEASDYDRRILLDMIRDEEETLKEMEDYWKENQPHTLMKHRMKLASYQMLLESHEQEGEVPSITKQPELPVMTNNEQRAAFVDAYETWPIWIDTKETGERYYRYELPDATMVVKVYFHKCFDYNASASGRWEERYRDDWGNQEYYLIQDGKYFKDCRANRSTLMDYLKEIQKKG